jgi:hypothetical protein
MHTQSHAPPARDRGHRRPRVRPVRTVVACLALLIGVAAAAACAGAEPVTVAPVGEHAAFPVMAIDGTGDTTVAWESSTRPYRVRAATRTRDSPAFGAPFSLASTQAEARLGALVAGPRGDTAVAWSGGPLLSGSDFWLQLRAAGTSGFGAPVKISLQGPGESLGAAGIALTIDAQGGVTAIWVSVAAYPDLRSRVLAATLPAGGSAFSAPVEVAPAGGSIRSLGAAVDADGGVTAAWARDNGARNVIQTAHRDAGPVSWSAPQDLSDDGLGQDGGSALDVHVAAGPAGSGTVAWIELVSGPHQIAQAARRVAGAESFGPAQTLSSLDPRSDAQKVKVGVDANGEAVVAWELDNPTITIGSPPLSLAPVAPAAPAFPDRIETAWSAAGATTFAPVAAASDPTVHSLQPSLVAGPKGGFVLSYAQEPQDTVKLTTRGAGPASTWGVPRVIAHAFGSQLAVGPDGDGTILWQEDGVPKIQDLDTTAPVPDGLTVPASAVPAESLTMSVMPHDRLSALDQTTWRFGDGASATGNSVSHAYATPGRKTVTVTVADVVGNTVSVTRDVDVTPVPVPPGSGAPGVAPPPPRALPRITKASLSPRRLRPARRGSVLIARKSPRTGARLRFTASQPGTVALTLASVKPGRRATHGRCSTKARRGRRCSLATTVARASARVRQGPVALVLSGRAKGHALKPGHYRLQLQLTAAGGARSAVTTLALTVVR